MVELNEAIKAIKNKNDLITILNSYGIQLNKENKTNCPFHKEKTPSFFAYEDEGVWKYKCHGCGEQGDIVNFIQKQENLSIFEATKKAYEILSKPFEVEPSKLDNFIIFISKNSKLEKEDGLYKYENNYIYKNDNNDPVYMKVKYRNNENNKKTFITKSLIETDKSYKFGDKEHFSNTNKYIYNYPKVKKAIENNHNVYFVEGEKDANNLIRRGFTATTIYSKHWEEAYKKQLTGSKIVFIGDTGKAGEEFKNLVWNNLKNVVQSFKIVTLAGLEDLGDNKDVTDWLEAGHTKDDLLEAIKDSWDWKVSTKWKDVIKVNKPNGIVEIKPQKTLDNFKLILKRTNTEVYVNEITKVMEVKTTTFNNKTLDTLMIEIQSLCTKIGFKCNKTDVRDFVETIAQEKSVNPFKVWVDQLPIWDKTSRIDEYLENFVTVDGYDIKLKKILMTKWLLSFLGTIYDPNYKAYGLLVLKGDQGIGKGECFKRLIPINENWVFLAEGKFKGDRDNIQILTSNLLVELSEFARSAKAVDEIKGFVTADVDKLSLKYDKYATTSKRNTVYFATINDGEFLIDDENRRFWIVDLESINWEGISNFDYVQLWAELKEIYLANPIVEGQPCYHLTPKERKLLQESNRQFNYEGKIATELRKVFDFNSPVRIWLSGSEIARLGDLKESSTAITRELKKMGEETSQRKSFKDIPRGRYNACGLPREWKGHVEPQWKERLVTNLTLVENNNDVENVNNLSYKDTTELEKENRKLKKLITELKSDLRKVLDENKRLREENLNWEALLMVKEHEVN